MTDQELTRAIRALYRPLGLSTAIYVEARLRLAPILNTIRYVPVDANILDLGCGHGIVANLFALQNPARLVTGVDKDEKRIRVAQQTARSDRVKFVVGDVCDVPAGRVEVITLIDVLHHVPFAAQAELLAKIWEALPRHGRLILKDLETEPRWKYWCHYVQDSISYRERLYFRSALEMSAMLRRQGFQSDRVPLGHGRPHPHVLYQCVKA